MEYWKRHFTGIKWLKFIAFCPGRANRRWFDPACGRECARCSEEGAERGGSVQGTVDDY